MILPPTYPLPPHVPQKLPDPKSKYIFSNFLGAVGVEWTFAAGEAAVDVATGIKITSLNATPARIEKALIRDMTAAGNEVIYFELDIDDVSKLHATSGVTVSFSTGGTTFANQYYKTLTPTSLISGINRFACTRGQMTSGGTPNWADVQNVKCVARSITGQTINVTWRRLEIRSNDLAKGVVIPCYDDGYDSLALTVQPMLDALGIRASVFPIWSAMGVTAGNLTIPQLKSLQDNSRWDVGGHAYSLHVDWRTLTDGQLRTEQERMHIAAAENGVDLLDLVAHPRGLRDNRVERICSEYWSYQRHAVVIGEAVTEPSPLQQQSMRLANLVGSSTGTPGAGGETPVATATGWVDQAEAQKTVLVLLAHKVVDAYSGSGDRTIEYPTANYQAVMNYAVGRNVDILNFSQYFERNGIAR